MYYNVYESRYKFYKNDSDVHGALVSNADIISLNVSTVTMHSLTNFPSCPSPL